MTTWTNLEDITLSEISQMQKDKYYMTHLYMESKIVTVMEADHRMVVARGWVEGEMGSCWSRHAKFQLCKMTKFWGSNVQQCGCS